MMSEGEEKTKEKRGKGGKQLLAKVAVVVTFNMDTDKVWEFEFLDKLLKEWRARPK